ncbi:hypothetical protein BRC90_01245 [Halobacteriales archaeon QS_4_69_34]|nr:MAG: hypothetical protein BRC90_01245 [Halobacteriales archaeon QS_4_69_34]
MSNGVRNLLLVVVDALRADRVGVCTGSTDDSLTPNIDELAREGAVFSRASTASNATDASVTSIHTGHYPRTSVYHHANLVTNTEKSRAEQLPTVPGQLRAAGWRTVAVAPGIGRWHKNGFDVLRSENSPEGTRLQTMYDAIESISPSGVSFGPRIHGLLPWSGAPDYGEEFTAPYTDQLLDEIGADPFYGFFRILDPHIPYTPSEDLVDELHAEREYPDQDLESVLAGAPDGGFLDTSIRPWLTPRDFEGGLSRLCARYDAGVVQADRKIGYLWDRLQERGRWEETALVVCSDHGESLYEHDIFADHHGLYDETMHVPLIVTTPETCGTRHDELVQLPDIAPTITDILGVDSSLGAFGRSLLPLLEEGRWDEREAVYAEEAYTQRRTAVRTDDWKYIRHVPDEALPTNGMECRYCETVHGPPPELYDLEQDPDEQRNVVEAHPAVVERLRDSYENLLETLPVLDDEGRAVEYDDEEDVLDQLERLGYR